MVKLANYISFVAGRTYIILKHSVDAKKIFLTLNCMYRKFLVNKILHFHIAKYCIIVKETE